MGYGYGSSSSPGNPFRAASPRHRQPPALLVSIPAPLRRQVQSTSSGSHSSRPPSRGPPSRGTSPSHGAPPPLRRSSPSPGPPPRSYSTGSFQGELTGSGRRPSLSGPRMLPGSRSLLQGGSTSEFSPSSPGHYFIRQNAPLPSPKACINSDAYSWLLDGLPRTASPLPIGTTDEGGAIRLRRQSLSSHVSRPSTPSINGNTTASARPPGIVRRLSNSFTPSRRNSTPPELDDSKYKTELWNLSNQRLQRLVEECGVTWTDADAYFREHLRKLGARPRLYGLSLLVAQEQQSEADLYSEKENLSRVPAGNEIDVTLKIKVEIALWQASIELSLKAALSAEAEALIASRSPSGRPVQYFNSYGNIITPHDVKAIVNQSFLRWCKERERVEAEYEPRHFLPQLPRTIDKLKKELEGDLERDVMTTRLTAFAWKKVLG